MKILITLTMIITGSLLQSCGSTKPVGFSEKKCNTSCQYYEGYKFIDTNESGCVCEDLMKKNSKNKKL